MARHNLRRQANVQGTFFVDASCIDCDACRQFAPSVFGRRGEQSAVVRQPTGEQEILDASKALVSCPTGSIGTIRRIDLSPAVKALPEHVDDDVWRCGFTSEKSFGAFSYLIAGRDDAALVDSPRFSRRLARNIEQLAHVRTIALTHSDDVADHRQWAEHFQANRVLHARDAGRHLMEIERRPAGDEPVSISPHLLMIPTPGHTAGHSVFLYRSKFLFTGDHLSWEPVRKRLHAFRGVCWYDWDTQVRSMERLLDYEFEWVLPGHGRPVRLPAPTMKRELVELIERMKRW